MLAHSKLMIFRFVGINKAYLNYYKVKSCSMQSKGITAMNYWDTYETWSAFTWLCARVDKIKISYIDFIVLDRFLKFCSLKIFKYRILIYIFDFIGKITYTHYHSTCVPILLNSFTLTGWTYWVLKNSKTVKLRYAKNYMTYHGLTLKFPY